MSSETRLRFLRHTIAFLTGVVTGSAVGAVIAVTAFADINCSGLCEGNAQDNTMWGSPYSDLIYGYGGDDRIHAAAGNDDGYGGIGQDRLDGEGGTDQMFGQGGSDQYSCPPATCGIMGGGGDDVLVGHEDSDVLWGGSDRDHIEGNADGDALVGTDDGAGDFLYGGEEGYDVDHCFKTAVDSQVGCEHVY